MRSVFRFISLFLLLSVSGCGDEDCNLDCFTPPNPFLFELVDKTSGENLFSNGTYRAEDITVVDRLTGQGLEFGFISEKEQNIIAIHSIGWETEVVDALVSHGADDIFTLFVDAERLSENCCSFTRYKDIRIGIAEYQKDPASDIYSILIDTGSQP